jgi:hypothetical protein
MAASLYFLSLGKMGGGGRSMSASRDNVNDNKKQGFLSKYFLQGCTVHMYLVQVSGSALIGNEGSPGLRAPMRRGGSFSQKLSQLTPLTPLSGLTPSISPCSVESAVS